MTVFVYPLGIHGNRTLRRLFGVKHKTSWPRHLMLDFNTCRLDLHSVVTALAVAMWCMNHTIHNQVSIHCCTTLYRACIYSRVAHHRLIRMKYRGRTEVTSDILEAAIGGATKTKIMYKAFLSYAQLKEYLAMLIQNGLMAHNIDGDTYRTTHNGLKFLESSRQLDGLLAPRAPENRLIRHVWWWRKSPAAIHLSEMWQDNQVWRKMWMRTDIVVATEIL